MEPPTVSRWLPSSTAPSATSRAGRLASWLLRGGLGVCLVVGLSIWVAPRAAAPVDAGAEALPDLDMTPLRDFQIQWVNGRRMLRFTAAMANAGVGQFELRGSRTSTSQPMQVNQVIFQTSGRDAPIARIVPTGAVGKWSGDGHNHWHVQEMMRYDLWGGHGTMRGAKVGFCFLDSDPWNLSLPGAVGSFYYRGSWCSTDPNALSNKMGISIGWSDEYEWYLAWQWIDITDVPGGTYTVRANVDPYGFFEESSETNQCRWVRLSFTGASNQVNVLAAGSECADDWRGSPFGADIGWMIDAGISTGCGPDLFCTYNRITRGEMAAFLDRALVLPPTPTDYFTDDEASPFEISINRLAAAGISTGCGGGRYCPNANVTRGEMAAYLDRALELAPTANDYFTDDESSIFEISINRLAASGIASGCAEGIFCPTTTVLRGETAAFLHRALDD